jgi:hypothetical protein
MIVSQKFAEDRQSALVELARLGEFTQSLEHAGEIVDVSRHVRVKRAESRLVNRQSALEELARLGEFTQILEHAGEIVEKYCDVRMISAKDILV